MAFSWADATLERLHKLIRDEDFNEDKSVPRSVGLLVIQDELKTGSLEDISELVFMLIWQYRKYKKMENAFKRAREEMTGALDRARRWIDSHNLVPSWDDEDDE